MTGAQRRLVDWPWVTVEVECSLCHRHGRYRLARLAERLGAERDLRDVLHIVSARCTIPRWDEPVRQYEARCGVRYRVPAGGPVPEGLPAREVRPDEPTPQPRRRRLGPDGPKPMVADVLRQGITHVDVHCYGINREGVHCHHTARVALAGLMLPGQLSFVDIGRACRLRCRRCGCLRANVTAIGPDPRKTHARHMSGGGSTMREVNGVVMPSCSEPSNLGDPVVPSMPDREAYDIVQDDDDTYAVFFARTGTVVQLNGVPQLGLDRADDVADHLEALDRIATARATD